MPDAIGRSVPNALAARTQPFRGALTAPTWRHVLVLVMGVNLVEADAQSLQPFKGLERVARFANYHRVLNRNVRSSRWLSRRLFGLLVDTFAPRDDPVVVGPVDTMKRRWGARIKARGIYRNRVRSSHGNFVKSSGLRRLSLMLLPEIPWQGVAEHSRS
jgi:hypothetical protein